MNREEIQRQRNIELSKELEEIKFELEYNKQLNQEGYKKAKDLIAELEELKLEWKENITELKKKNDEYSFLINELRAFRDIILSQEKKEKRKNRRKE